jgi:hypothetical protein
MKNLKKVLAAVLVAALAFSLMAVAGAKQITDFSDASGIKYTEAVDLLAGLGIIQGSGGTTFDPKGTFTREQAAKIVAYLSLGTAVADTLPTTTSRFSDVAPPRWSAPFIAYCAAQGIINGLGDGTFNPTAPVTGTGMAKLLLTAIGYGAKGEYTGPNWEINTLVKAQSLGILDTGVNYSAPATREEVAKYAFNVMTKPACYTVDYNAVLGTYTGNLPASPTNTDKFNQGLGHLTFNLNKVAEARASYTGVDSHHWAAGVAQATVSGSYSDDIVIAASTNGTLIADMLSVASPAYKASADTSYDDDGVSSTPAKTTVTYWINGEKDDGSSDYVLSDADAVAAKVGAVVKLLDNDADGCVDNVWLLAKTVSMLSAAPSVNAAGTVTIYGSNGIPSTYAKGHVVYPAGLSAFDFVTYVTIKGVTYIDKCTKVTGTMTAGSAAKVTFAGTTYTKSTLTGSSIMSTSAAANYNKAATGWLDGNGYLVALSTDTVVSQNYGLLVGYVYTPDALGGGAGTAKARLYTTDGKVAIYDVAANALGIVPDQSTDFDFSASKAYLVTYAINADGKVILTAGNAPANLTLDYAARSTTVKVGTDIKYLTSATRSSTSTALPPGRAATSLRSRQASPGRNRSILHPITQQFPAAPTARP